MSLERERAFELIRFKKEGSIKKINQGKVSGQNDEGKEGRLVVEARYIRVLGKSTCSAAAWRLRGSSLVTMTVTMSSQSDDTPIYMIAD